MLKKAAVRGQVPFLLAERARSECARSHARSQRAASATPLMRGMRSRKILAAVSLNGLFEHPHYMLPAWHLTEHLWPMQCAG